MAAGGFLSWSRAMQEALYGPEGFYRARGGPAAHFRTSVHASPLFAAAIVQLLRETDDLLGHPDELALVDVGAGGGELLEGVLGLLAGDPIEDRLRPVAVELAGRPQEADARVEWRDALPVSTGGGTGLTGLLVANEWLDNVPCDAAELTAEGWRLVEVAADGRERLGPRLDKAQQEWLDAWWPVHPAVPNAGEDGDHGAAPRAEIGLSRDEAWLRATGALGRGVAVAIDYSHTLATRPPYGSLTGYAQGRQVIPIPDGSCDITAHVALDACAAATSSAVEWTAQGTQRDVLHSLGMTGQRPPIAMASSDPTGYLRALSRASAISELTDPDGLGGFGWLVQGVGTTNPLHSLKPGSYT